MEDYVPKPSSHLALAILTTILCCLPLGIVAIVKASKVDSYYMAKQYELARQASSEAKTWSLVGIGISALGLIIYFVFIAIVASAGFML